MNATAICLFTFNRFEETQKTIEALQRNYNAEKAILYLFSDGPRNESDQKRVDAVREYLEQVRGFGEVHLKFSKENKGLARSIISGVTQVISKHKRAVVVEDDLVTSPNFLNFMTQGLDFYENDSRILSVTGYSHTFKSMPSEVKDMYFGTRAMSWGWATWENEWNQIDWEVKNYASYNASFKQKLEFSRIGSDLPGMLKLQMTGKIDSWAIRFCFHAFMHNKLTVFPAISKIENVGIGVNATHTKHMKGRFRTKIDPGKQKDFTFVSSNETQLNLNDKIRATYSVFNRLKDKLPL